MISALILAAAIQPVALPPFTFVGRITDYAHIAYDAEASVEVRAKTSDGTLLAKTTTATGGNSSFNYRLDIPLASRELDGHLKTGESVVFEFVDPGGKIYSGLVSGADSTLGAPGDYRRVDVILATDANHDGVADEYVEALAYLMWVNGIAEYDPKADSDGDGVSNFDEYIAGTNPFDPTDRFSVREMAIDKGADGYVAFRFLVNQGRVYSVVTSERLEAPEVEWVEAPFSVSDPAEALQMRLSTGAAETGYRTVFLKKGEDPSRFWKMKVE